MKRLPRQEVEMEAAKLKADPVKARAAKSKTEVDVSCSNHLKKRNRKRNRNRNRRKKLGDGIEQAPPPPPPWVNLPREITSMILQKLGSVELLLTARRVCTTWRNICKGPAMWRIIDIVTDKLIDHFKVWKTRSCAVDTNQLRKLCCHAVDLSQGELIDIEVDCDDKLLDYIAQRSPKLRCLRLSDDYDNNEEAISEAVKKLPLLEEVHLIYHSIYDTSIQTIIDIANYCPLLTSLSLNAHGYQGYRLLPESNRLAFAVSRIHKLRHLKMFGSNMTNEGLTAILNGCPELESLDLRKCRNLDLDGKLGERCRKQIKHLRLPKDSIKDYLMVYYIYDEYSAVEDDDFIYSGDDNDETSVTPRPPPQWVNLPREITFMILEKLGLVEKLSTARRVCTTWRNICKDPTMWRVISIDEDYYTVYKAPKLFCHAVDLSQGELIDVDVYCNYELLEYISQRSPKLRRLNLLGYSDDQEETISDTVKKLPLLEELHLIYESIYEESMQMVIDIGNSCPLMTSLSLNAHGDNANFRLAPDSNRLAFAVSRIHKLRHLRMFASNMTNEGLIAILDGCPELESLDLRKCRNLKLDGKLGERCCQQIKYLRLPKDSIKDYLTIYSQYDGFTESENEEFNNTPYTYADWLAEGRTWRSDMGISDSD